MSRCLPYTPSVKAANREALLEPIKLPRELEKKAKIHRKKEKKEKKEKKVKSQNRKGHKEDELSTCATIWGVDAIARYPQEVESNQLEKSDITEEHELPTLSENMSYLSDGTQSGAKRKRTIIRFKSLSKRSDPVSSDASCSEPTSGKADFETDLKMTEIVHAPSAQTNVEFEKAASTSDQKLSTCDHAEDVLHQSLIVNWVQPLLQSVLDDYGDQDWLFETKRENSHGSKRFKASNEVLSGYTSQTFWPQARWLPESGLSALPFTVPF
ncbi:PREDICTED: DNA ligase 1 [Fragaria vesca subsp. vesca]|uniref:DNA ligase 1 n=1 Tax=Fragaria vesca subsp. vesca TaxID=101020 RepID=UPI0002C2EC9A|nr:PREDICTED: DNA ligase 1 [Fragaria vesca subsp. vesca]